MPFFLASEMWEVLLPHSSSVRVSWFFIEKKWDPPLPQVKVKAHQLLRALPNGTGINSASSFLSVFLCFFQLFSQVSHYSLMLLFSLYGQRTLTVCLFFVAVYNIQLPLSFYPIVVGYSGCQGYPLTFTLETIFVLLPSTSYFIFLQKSLGN